jgi:hypothetical protein
MGNISCAFATTRKFTENPGTNPRRYRRRKVSAFAHIVLSFSYKNNIQRINAMAPNQTKLASITQTLSQLDLASLAVKSEFLPLTHPKEQQKQRQEVVIQATTTINSDDYWSWTPSVDDTQETFSVSHIEEKLIQDAQRRSTKVEIVVSSTPQVEGYWDMSPSETDSPTPKTVHAQHESYWDWQSDAKDVFSADSIVENLVHHTPKTSTDNVVVSTNIQEDYWDETSDNVVRAARTHASYWDWDSTAKSQLISLIQREEEARLVLSTHHIEENLIQAAHDHYWKWEVGQQSSQDAYWDWSADSKQAPVVAIADYWDW